MGLRLNGAVAMLVLVASRGLSGSPRFSRLSSAGKRAARSTLWESQGGSCLMCRDRFRDIVPADIHHIDHDRTNNDLGNLALLCCNCHAAIHRNGVKLLDAGKIISHSNQTTTGGVDGAK